MVIASAITLVRPTKMEADVSNTAYLAPQVTVVESSKITTKADLVDKVYHYADKYGVSRDLANYIVSNESHYDTSAVGDEKLVCKRTGQSVYARGLMQITRCFHPGLSDKDAFDPDKNLDYGMKLASDKATCMEQFSTCRDYYN